MPPRADDLVAVVAGGGEHGAGQAARPRLGGHPGQRLELRDDRLVAEIAGELRPGQDETGLGAGVLGQAAGAQDPGQDAPQPGFLDGRQRPGQRVARDPGGLSHPAGRGESFGRGDQAGQRALIAGRGQLQRPRRQVGCCLRGRRQGLRRRLVQSGQRGGITGVRGLEQVPGGERRRSAAAQQDLRVLAVQRLTGRLRDHLGDGAADKRVPEREGVVSCGHDPGAHRLLNHGQQRGRGLGEHVSGIFQPERRSEDGRDRQQVPGPAAEAFQPLMDGSHDPLRRVRGDQHGVAAGDPDGVVVTQATDQLGEQQRVPCGPRAQGQQVRARRRAERVGEQARHRVAAERAQGDPGSAVPLQHAEQQFRVFVPGAGPGEDPGDGVALQLPRQRPQCGQHGGAGPLQVIQADQDRSHRGPPFQVGPQSADPPGRRVQQPVRVVPRDEPAQRLQGGAQGEERDRPAQPVRCPRRQRESLPGCLAYGLAEQPGLADALLALDQDHAAGPPLGAPQHVTNGPPLGITPVHDPAVGGPCGQHGLAADPGRRVVDGRRHISASTGDSSNAARAATRAQRIRMTAISGWSPNSCAARSAQPGCPIAEMAVATACRI
jgi:hypothetical protein